MQRFGVYLVILIVSLLICQGTVCGAPVLIQVYETDGNITPVSGAQVYVNNTLVGKTDEGGMFDYNHPGTKVEQLRIEKFGFDTWNGNLDVNITPVFVEMQKSKIALIVQLYDADTMGPIAGADVTLSGGTYESVIQSDSNGTARFTVQIHTPYRIRIDAEQYQPASMDVESGISEKVVQSMLFRTDRFSLVVKDDQSGDPLPGARILIEGREQGTTDPKGVLTLPLPRGKVYLIRVVKEGYQDYNGRQIVESNTAFLTIPLTKAPYTIFVSVYNEDKEPVEGARILIGKTSAGTTSRYGRATILNLTAGQYLMEIQHPGYISVRQPLTVAVQGEDIVTELAYLRANVTLKTTEGSSKPVPKVKISINGEETGVTDTDGILPVRLRIDYPYEILAEKEGYHLASIVYTGNSSDMTDSLTIPMNRSINWMLIGIAGILIVAVLGAVILFRKRGHGPAHGRRGGL